MQCKYRFQTHGVLRIDINFPLIKNDFRYELEVDEKGAVRYISVYVSVSDRNMWPTIDRRDNGPIRADINITNPFFSEIKDNLRASEGLLSLFGLDRIDINNPEIKWIPENDEEKKVLNVSGFKSERIKRPITDYAQVPFNLVARSILASTDCRHIETALSFYRKGRLDIEEERYIDAVSNFLFMIESLYANGKFRSKQVVREFTNNSELLSCIEQAIRENIFSERINMHRNIKVKYDEIYSKKTPNEMAKLIVDLRGFLRHHTSKREDIWHPEDHIRFGADAFALYQICFKIAFKISEPYVFSDEIKSEYINLADQSNVRS